jgi:hypothetical protein
MCECCECMACSEILWSSRIKCILCCKVCYVSFSVVRMPRISQRAPEIIIPQKFFFAAIAF